MEWKSGNQVENRDSMKVCRITIHSFASFIARVLMHQMLFILLQSHLFSAKIHRKQTILLELGKKFLNSALASNILCFRLNHSKEFMALNKYQISNFKTHKRWVLMKFDRSAATWFLVCTSQFAHHQDCSSKKRRDLWYN